MKLQLSQTALSVHETGTANGAPVVFLHALGTGAVIWDSVLPLLPGGLRLVTIDLRGHGDSDSPKAPYSMGALVRDVEEVLDSLHIRDAIMVGVSLGGMIAQGLAVKRLDQIRGLVLCNTATRFGQAAQWDSLAAEIAEKGTAPMCARTMQNWFTKEWLEQEKHRAWRDRFLAISTDAMLGHIAAIKGTDFYTPTSGLRLALLAIAGSEDRMVPPDMTREISEIVPGAQFKIIRKSGHLPPVDQPKEFAACLSAFLIAQAHIRVAL